MVAVYSVLQLYVKTGVLPKDVRWLCDGARLPPCWTMEKIGEPLGDGDIYACFEHLG